MYAKDPLSKFDFVNCILNDIEQSHHRLRAVCYVHRNYLSRVPAKEVDEEIRRMLGNQFGKFIGENMLEGKVQNVPPRERHLPYRDNGEVSYGAELLVFTVEELRDLLEKHLPVREYTVLPQGVAKRWQENVQEDSTHSEK